MELLLKYIFECIESSDGNNTVLNRTGGGNRNQEESVIYDTYTINNRFCLFFSHVARSL